MDISNIKSDAITTNGGFHFGDPNAPIKVVEFINLRCPYCKMWWEDASPILDKYVNENKVERIVKLFDKEKPGLRKGNVLHSFLDYNDLEKTRKDIDYYVKHLDDWGDLPEEEVAAFAENNRDAEKQSNQEEAQAIIKEADKANVTLVPSIFIEDYIFDEHITGEELKSIIDIKLERDEEREPNQF